MLSQPHLSGHQLECNKTWTLITLAIIPIDDIVKLQVKYTVVAKLDKRNATVHSVTAIEKMLVSMFVWC
jgi:hypothetical protein